MSFLGEEEVGFVAETRPSFCGERGRRGKTRHRHQSKAPSYPPNKGNNDDKSFYLEMGGCHVSLSKFVLCSCKATHSVVGELAHASDRRLLFFSLWLFHCGAPSFCCTPVHAKV